MNMVYPLSPGVQDPQQWQQMDQQMQWQQPDQQMQWQQPDQQQWQDPQQWQQPNMVTCLSHPLAPCPFHMPTHLARIATQKIMIAKQQNNLSACLLT